MLCKYLLSMLFISILSSLVACDNNRIESSRGENNEINTTKKNLVAAPIKEIPTTNTVKTATDSNGDQPSKQVTHNIKDIAEPLPVITSDASAEIIENAGVGKVVYNATAGDSNGVAFRLAGDDAKAFSIDASSGDVRLKDDPDYEKKRIYNFAVIATDAAGNNSTSKSVTLSVTNMDDSAPIIDSGDKATLTENTGTNQKVYETIAADDSRDIKVKGPLKYSLTGDDAKAFSIDASSGEVKLIDNPHFESREQYLFDVVATDSNGNQSSQQVTLDIIDTVVIEDGHSKEKAVYKIDNCSSCYLKGDDSDKLKIKDDGLVYLTKDANYEEKSKYSFIVNNGYGNQKSQQVTLNIIDTILIENGHPKEKPVYEIDDCSSCYLKGDDAGKLEIKDDGFVYLKKRADYTEQRKYSFILIEEGSDKQKDAVNIYVAWFRDSIECNGIIDTASSESTGKDKVGLIELTDKDPRRFACIEAYDPSVQDQSQATGSAKIVLILNSNNDDTPQVFDNFEIQFNTSEVTNVSINGSSFDGVRYTPTPRRLTKTTDFTVEYDFTRKGKDNRERFTVTVDPEKHTMSGFTVKGLAFTDANAEIRDVLLSNTCNKGKNEVKDTDDPNKPYLFKRMFGGKRGCYIPTPNNSLHYCNTDGEPKVDFFESCCKYKLTGKDKDLFEIDGQGVVRLKEVSEHEKTYKFNVIAYNDHGDETPSTKKFTVEIDGKGKADIELEDGGLKNTFDNIVSLEALLNPSKSFPSPSIILSKTRIQKPLKDKPVDDVEVINIEHGHSKEKHVYKIDNCSSCSLEGPDADKLEIKDDGLIYLKKNAKYDDEENSEYSFIVKNDVKPKSQRFTLIINDRKYRIIAFQKSQKLSELNYENSKYNYLKEYQFACHVKTDEIEFKKQPIDNKLVYTKTEINLLDYDYDYFLTGTDKDLFKLDINYSDNSIRVLASGDFDDNYKKSYNFNLVTTDGNGNTTVEPIKIDIKE